MKFDDRILVDNVFHIYTWIMNASVLVVEDVVELSDLLNLYLSWEGLTVTVADPLAIFWQS